MELSQQRGAWQASLQDSVGDGNRGHADIYQVSAVVDQRCQ
jgi:hypothetical protein